MKDALLGANHWLSCFATCHAVTPPSEPLSSGHLSAAPPHGSSGIPRFFWYQAARALGSPVLLKKTPPIPVTFAMALPLGVSAIRRRRRRSRGQRALQQRDLAGMVQVVLGDADELRVRGVGRLGHEALVQPLRRKLPHGLPQRLVETPE